MLYDVLQAYLEYLLGIYSQETAETYYKRLCRLFEGQPVTDTVKRLDVELILGA